MLEGASTAPSMRVGINRLAMPFSLYRSVLLCVYYDKSHNVVSGSVEEDL